MSEWESVLQSLSSLGSTDGTGEGCLGLLLSSAISLVSHSFGKAKNPLTEGGDLMNFVSIHARSKSQDRFPYRAFPPSALSSNPHSGPPPLPATSPPPLTNSDLGRLTSV